MNNQAFVLPRLSVQHFRSDSSFTTSSFLCPNNLNSFLLMTSLPIFLLFLSALLLGCLSLALSACRCPHVDCSETASPAPVCQACLEKKFGGSLSGTSAKAGQGQSKVVTFGGVTELERPVGKATAGEGVESGLLRRLLSKATVTMPTIGLKVSQLSEWEGRYERGPNHSLIWSLLLQ